MLLFVVSANVGCCIFTYSNEKFTNVFVRAFTKSDATGLHFGKPSYRLENCRATVSLNLCYLHLRSKLFQFRAIWRHKLQGRHVRNWLIRVHKGCMFHWFIDCRKYYCLIYRARKLLGWPSYIIVVIMQQFVDSFISCYWQHCCDYANSVHCYCT